MFEMGFPFTDYFLCSCTHHFHSFLIHYILTYSNVPLCLFFFDQLKKMNIYTYFPISMSAYSNFAAQC